jgi:uncharacterized protein YkwD
MSSSHSTRRCALVCGAALLVFGLAGATSAQAAARADCVNADLALTASNTDDVRAAVLCLINADRTQRRLTPLRENAKLRTAALAHSSDMVRNGYFAHTAPNGDTFVDRILDARYTTLKQDWSLGENLAWGTGSLGTARGVQTAWMRSSGHRANILKSAYRELGIGVRTGVPTDSGVGATFTTDFGVKG